MATEILNHTFHIELIMRKVLNHISFSFDPITSVTAVLVVVIAFLQWRASRKQYKQNLFKMRLDFYTKIKNYPNVLLDFQNIQSLLFCEKEKNSDKLDEEIKKIKEITDAALRESGEIIFLFGKRAGREWREFFNLVYVLANTIDSKTTEEDLANKLTELNKKQIKVFNSFNGKLNL